MSDRFTTAISAIDTANADDPHGREVVYGQRMSTALLHLAPNASEALRLAARAQHVRRWEVVRTDFPEGRKGYRDWRQTAMRHHADIAGTILAGAGYDESTIDRVGALLVKRELSTDAETQALEDAICLVFLQYYAEEFAEKHAEAKVIRILGQTWTKMSAAGRSAALSADLPAAVRALVTKATE